MTTQTLNFDRAHVLYAADLLPAFSMALFEPTTTSDRGINQQGRGNAYFYSFQGIDVVLRHYQRGGLVRFFSRDLYFFHGLENTRMWREFRLLDHLCTLGLPVPQPVAVRCQQLYCSYYRGDLVTQTIPDTQTLAQYLTHHSLTESLWRRLGEVIARFHQANVYHADLNANNILIDRHEQFYLIDFDRGELRPKQDQQWQSDNLQRLLRSLKKLQRLSPSLQFQDSKWHLLLAGYKSAEASKDPNRVLTSNK